MIPPVRYPAYRLPWYQRLILVAMGGGLIGLLVVAATLAPSKKGYGTHEQLGLSPCTLYDQFGIPCPSCGMTTSWSHTVRGHVPSALRANVGGTLMAVLAALAGPWLLLSGLLGRWFWRRPNEWIAIGIAVTIVSVTMIDWGVRLYRMWE